MNINNNIIPEVLNNFGVYDGDGDKMIGITDEMSTAELANKVATITGAGISGSYDVPIVGQYDSIKQEIPFRVLYDKIAKYANPMKQVSVNVRGALQVTDKSTGVSDFMSIRYAVKGRNITTNPGSLRPGEAMGARLTIEATYLLYEVNGEKLIEIDKLNGVCYVGGEDVMAKVRKMC